MRLVALLAAALPATVAAAPAVDTASSLSWQGYTGLFNIPHARVTPYGVGTAGYSQPIELAGKYRTGSNYLLSLGLLPNVEVSGRIAATSNDRNAFTNPPPGPSIRDLSFNAKFRLPLPDAWPALAVGAQDPAGETQDFAAEYAVATQEWGPLDLTLGVGRSDSGLGRLDGAFGGVEWAATDWLDVIAEHDAHAANAGVRLHHTLRVGGVPLRVDLSLQGATSASDQDGTFAGLSLSFPLGGRTQAETVTPASAGESSSVGSTSGPVNGGGNEENRQASASDADAGDRAPALESASMDSASGSMNAGGAEEDAQTAASGGDGEGSASASGASSAGSASEPVAGDRAERDAQASPAGSSAAGANRAAPSTGGAGDAPSASADESAAAAPSLPPAFTDYDGYIEMPRVPALLGRLERHGFENLSVGREGDVLYVRAENTIYNRNEVDGLGVLLGEAVEAAAGEFARVRVILLNAGMPVIGVEAATRPWRCYLGRCADTGPDPAAARSAIRTFDPTDDDAVAWRYTDINASTLRPRLIFSPAVVTGVATEVGVLDYSLGLRGELRVPLWAGAQAIATGIAPIAESEDFEDGAIFEDAALESGIRDLVLQQALPIGPVTLQASGGLFRYDYRGGLAEGFVQLGDGRHRLTAKAGAFENREIESAETRELGLGSYRYYEPRLDAAIEVTAGRFWGQDEGAMVETHHHFGDTTISLFYRDTVAEFVGIRATIPLTPRRDMDPRGFQVRGDPRWRYSLRTRVGEDRNTVDFATGDTLRRDSGLEQQFFNDDRLNGAYIRRHTARMREAWLMAR